MTIRPRFSKAKAFFAIGKETRLRLAAIFLLALFWTSIIIPSGSALALAEIERRQTEASTRSQDIAKQHIRPPKEGVANTDQDDFNSPAPIAGRKSSYVPAADHVPSESPIPGLPPFKKSASFGKNGQMLQQPNLTKSVSQEQEVVAQRTANTRTFRNKDGSLTTRRYYAPQFFQKDGGWQPIDTTLIEDRNAGDSGNAFGRALGFMQSWVKDESTFTVKENNWQARFAPSDSEQGMVRIASGKDQVRFSPANARSVKPVITTDSNGKQTVHYYDVWPGVDIEYAVLAAELKENIILKDKRATADFAFTISGGSLEKTKADAAGNFGYIIKGVMNDDLAIAPLAISLNKYGFEARQPITQKLEGNKLSISVDRGFLQNLPDDAYPVILDPTTVFQSRFGSRAGGNYLSFKSDGYVCDSTICNPLAGSVLDSQGVWRAWRGMIFSDYSFVKGKQLNNATLHLTQRLGLSTSGTTAVKNFRAWHAGCFAYGCLGAGRQHGCYWNGG